MPLSYYKNKRYHCEHNVYKYHCVDCGGSQVCEHKKFKSSCKECKNLKVCKEHGNDKFTCNHCNAAILLSLQSGTW
jgi:ribosomal protein S27E